MRYTNSFKRLAMLAAMVAMIGLSVGHASGWFDRHVQVRNNSNKKIVKVLASADGEKYTVFHTGNGIKPGQTVDLAWDKSNGHDCQWYLKAIFADTSESAPAQFDFCTKDVLYDID